ncbi:MAG: response regulator transcription factor [Elusimicrobia bacterium]|nr:response regulator transcription factor [Elusimicrobiota bacterium]
MPRILIVDDDASIAELVQRTLSKSIPDCSVCVLRSGKKVLATALAYRPQLMILDWVLGRGETGASICRALKSNRATKDAAILVITGQRLSENDRMKSIAFGADAYLPKPFTLKRLVGHAKALLRRSAITNRPSGGTLEAAGLALNRRKRDVCAGESGVRRLPPRLFNLLWLLVKHYPQPVSARYFLRYAWPSGPVRDNEVAVEISRLKHALEGLCSIETVPGAGYRLARRS